MHYFCRVFSFRYALVFGTPAREFHSRQQLKVVGRAGQWRKVLNEAEVNLLQYPLEHAPSRYSVHGPDSEELAAIQGIKPERLGDCQFIFVPVPLHPQSSIAFLVGYTQEHGRNQPENRPSQELDNALQSFKNLVVSLLSAILTRRAELHALDQLRYLGHEIGQLSAGIDWHRRRFFDNPQRLRALDVQKAEDLCADLTSFTRQIHVHFQMVRMLSRGMPELQLESFQPHGDVLLKWKAMYRAEAEKKCLQFPQYLQGGQDLRRPPIVADRAKFEALVYNLVGNAVKYCYRGTKIHMDCVKAQVDGKPGFRLTVIDFGSEMVVTPETYELYGRGTEDTDGLGIGLFVAQLVAQVHRGWIRHDCERISPFNVPLLEGCLEPSNILIEPKIKLQAKQELERLDSEGVYTSIVARCQDNLLYEPYPETVKAEIEKPTFRVTATVFFPRWTEMTI